MALSRLSRSAFSQLARTSLLQRTPAVALTAALNAPNAARSSTMMNSASFHASRKLMAAAATASPAAAAKQPDMFCFQCEQTEHGTGCTTVGVCGKTPEVAALQDYLVHCVKGVGQYAKRARDVGKSDREVDRFVLRALFSTVTNVNFDPQAIADYIREAEKCRDRAKQLYEQGCKEQGKQPEKVQGPATFVVGKQSVEELRKLGETVGVLGRKAERGEDINGIQEMSMYGLKGACAYAEHARVLGQEDDAVFKNFNEILDALTNPKPSLESALGTAMQVGKTNLRVMELLDAGGTGRFGHPEPTKVSCNPKPGKCILVSGHDLQDLEDILKQTAGKGINVYTHGELLPAHGYPGLKKYPHLVGNYGGPWQLQKLEFANFPGAIVMTTNCLIEPRKSYKNRIFTRSVVGWPGVEHIGEQNDYSKVIKAAQECEGFTQEDVPAKPVYVMTGFARNAVLSQAGAIVDLVKSGKLSRFFLIGGCDGSEGERNYFKELAIASPKDSLILTLGCGKYRINKLELGNLGDTGIPRVLDMGQCNDAYSAITVAVALAKAFNTDVNSLPLSFAVSWFEQKAVAVLLTLLALNIKNIRLGPNLPGFATPAMLSVLQKNFNLSRIGTVDGDLKQMLTNH